MKIKIVTHGCGFHSDELFAIALIKKYVSSDVEILRTRDNSILEGFLRDDNVWVIDVGGDFNDSLKNFDHHQSEFSSKWKDSDIHYSSCGLIWTYLRKSGYLSQYSRWVLNEIECRLIKKIDLHDNGISRWSHAIMFKLFNRVSQNDFQFHAALQMAEHHLENSIYFICEEEVNRSSVDHHEYVCDGNIVVVSDGGFNIIPTISSMTNAKIIVESKLAEEGWSVQSIDSTIATPVIWRGLSGEQLEIASDMKGLIFAHRSGHLVKSKNRDAAIAAAKVMLGI